MCKTTNGIEKHNAGKKGDYTKMKFERETDDRHRFVIPKIVRGKLNLKRGDKIKLGVKYMGAYGETDYIINEGRFRVTIPSNLRDFVGLYMANQTVEVTISKKSNRSKNINE